MNKTFYLLFFIIFVVGCSEGDLIQDDINFEAPLQNCSNVNDFVFFKIGSDNSQVISLNFTSSSFKLDELPEGNMETIILNETSNSLIYRTFNSQITGDDYFCSSIPPADILVTQELISTSGNVLISYTPIQGQTYTRTILLSNITFKGADIEIRQESFELGSEEITFP